jgi:hypothetical protein
MSQLTTYTRRARYVASIATINDCCDITCVDSFYRYACDSFKSACVGKDPENLQAPSAHEIAWSHALTLARDAEAENLLCR